MGDGPRPGQEAKLAQDGGATEGAEAETALADGEGPQAESEQAPAEQREARGQERVREDARLQGQKESTEAAETQESTEASEAESQQRQSDEQDEEDKPGAGWSRRRKTKRTATNVNAGSRRPMRSVNRAVVEARSPTAHGACVSPTKARHIAPNTPQNGARRLSSCAADLTLYR